MKAIETIKNLEEFKELIRRYESITLEEINDAWLEGMGAERVARYLTGFGDSLTCSLCKAVEICCRSCVYGITNGCLDGKNEETYCNIKYAKSPDELLSAFRGRADHMKKIISENNCLSELTNEKRTCFFCNTELAEWQPDDDTICNSCANKIKEENQ